MSVTALAPWFGSNRTNAEAPGRLLQGCEWVGVPFAGGMCEVPHFDARTIVVNDLHKHVVNLARIAADENLGPKLYRKLKRIAFHPEELANAQGACIWSDDDPMPKYPLTRPDAEYVDWAVDYFVAVWMGRSSLAGTDKEFSGGLSLRWNAGGGDSAVRYQSAVKSMNAFRRTLRRCTFSCLDCFEFFDKVHDEPKHGLYIDAPWPKDGAKYKHKFDVPMQRRLADRLREFKRARVVIRFGDHPLIRELYSQWAWRSINGRTQTNDVKAEVLITNF